MIQVDNRLLSPEQELSSSSQIWHLLKLFLKMLTIDFGVFFSVGRSVGIYLCNVSGCLWIDSCSEHKVHELHCF